MYLVFVGFYFVDRLSKLIKKLLLSVFRWFVNILCLDWFVFVLSICNLLMRMVIFGMVKFSKLVCLIRCFVGEFGFLMLRKFWNLFDFGLRMENDCIFVCFVDVLVWLGVKGIWILILVFFVVFLIVVVLFSMIRFVSEIFFFFIWVVLKFFWMLISVLRMMESWFGLLIVYVFCGVNWIWVLFVLFFMLVFWYVDVDV